MKERIFSPGKRIVIPVLIIDALLLIVMLSIVFVCRNKADLMYSDKAAERWGAEDSEYSEISLFYSQDAGLGKNDIQSIRSEIQKKLYEDSYMSDDNVNRVWIDAYSGHCMDVIRKDSNTVKVNVYMVGGDFFMIHPIPLKAGNYPDLTSDDANQILLDEYVAWTLFGSNNVAGMKLWIGDEVFTVTGVVQVSDEKAYNQAYGEYNSVYVPIKAYSAKKENTIKADNYTAVIPNPIKNYALNTVAEAAGISFKTDEEKKQSRSELNFGDKEILENTGRYSVVSLWNFMNQRKYVDMKVSSITYPYWENISR